MFILNFRGLSHTGRGAPESTSVPRDVQPQNGVPDEVAETRICGPGACTRHGAARENWRGLESLSVPSNLPKTSVAKWEAENGAHCGKNPVHGDSQLL